MCLPNSVTGILYKFSALCLHIQEYDENGFGFTEDFFVTEQSSETQGLKLLAEEKEGELQQ